MEFEPCLQQPWHLNAGRTSNLAKFNCSFVCSRPTQWIMYVPSRVHRSQKCILLIVQYESIQSCSGDFYSPESDPPHKIMRYWVYYSTQLCFWFPADRIRQAEMICIGGVPVLKRHFGGAGPSIFYMIHRVLQRCAWTNLMVSTKCSRKDVLRPKIISTQGIVKKFPIFVFKPIRASGQDMCSVWPY